MIFNILFDQNHIHIFCGATPRLSPLRVISIIKSITAKQVFEKFPKLKKEYLGMASFGAMRNISAPSEKPPLKKLFAAISEIKA